VITCWDIDRFGRADLLESAGFLSILREAEVTLHTTRNGSFDFSSDNDVMLFMIQQKAKHEYLRDLGANVERAREAIIRNGGWFPSRTPFGYVCDRANGHKLIFGEPKDVATIRKIFEMYASGDSLRDICRYLNRRSFRTATGKDWGAATVRRILSNVAYIGHSCQNKATKSKYKAKHGKAVRKRIAASKCESGKTTLTLPQEEWIVHKNTHEPMIDAKAWAAVQRRRETNKRKKGKKSSAASYVLTGGLLRCGHCGAAMSGSLQNTRQKDVPLCDRVRYYQCCSYLNANDDRCERKVAFEDDVLKQVTKALKEQFFDRLFSDDVLPQLREEIAEQLDSDDFAADVASVRAEYDELTASIKDQLRYLMTARRERRLSESLIREGEKLLEDDQQRQTELAERLQQLDQPAPDQLTDLTQSVDDVLKWFDDVQEAILSIESEDKRRDLNRLIEDRVDHIEVDVERVPQCEGSTRHIHKLTGGRIYLRTADLPIDAALSIANLPPKNTSKSEPQLCAVMGRSGAPSTHDSPQLCVIAFSTAS
jgi:DNA invertase Pin-like site-specific DNA recombinase